MIRQSDASSRELSDWLGRDLLTTSETGFGIDRHRRGFDVGSGDDPLPLSERFSDEELPGPNDDHT